MEAFRLTIIPAIEKDPTRDKVFTFLTETEMIAANDTAADLLLFLQDDLAVMPDYSNIFLCEKLVAGEWIEWEQE